MLGYNLRDGILIRRFSINTHISMQDEHLIIHRRIIARPDLLFANKARTSAHQFLNRL